MSARAGAAARNSRVGHGQNTPHQPSAADHSTIAISSVKSHYYSQHTAALRAELGSAMPREVLQGAACKERRHVTCSIAARQFAFLVLATWGLIAVSNPLDLDSAGVRAGLHRLQLHGAPARSRAPHGLRPASSRGRARCSAGCTPCRAAFRRASSRAGTSITTRSSARRKTTRSGIICRRRSTRGGSSCSTHRRRCFRFISAQRGGRAPPIRRRCSSRSPSSAACRSSRTSRSLALIATFGGFAAALRAYVDSGVLRLPDRVHAESPRPALRHRSGRSRPSGAR